MRYKHIWLVVGCLTLGACSLDVPPQNQMTRENAFNTEKDLNTTTTAIHASMYNLIDNGLPAFIHAGELASEVSGGEGLRAWNPKSVLRLDVDWKGLYDMVFISHFLLDNIDKTQGLSPERRNYHRGQALFTLGLGYLNIVQRFGDCVLLDNSTRLSAYQLTPQLTVLNKAIEYAQEAYEILPVWGQVKDYRGVTLRAKQYASKGAAVALLAHLYAWKGAVIDNYKLTSEASKTAYEKSAEYASKLIAGEAGNYRLCDNPSDLCDKLSNPQGDNPEAIFSLVLDLNRNEGVSETPLPTKKYVAYPVNKNSTLGDLTLDTEYRIYKERINELYSQQDERRRAYFYEIDEVHEVNGQDYALPYKWRNAVYEANNGGEFDEEFRTLVADFVYWRLADIYLLRAECYAKIGRLAEAQQDLNTIRSRAGAEAYPATTDSDLKLAIFREREKELFAEGCRYLDVIRNGLWRTELQGNFANLSEQDVLGGALHLPTPEAAYKRNGITINTQIRESRYWSRYK